MSETFRKAQSGDICILLFPAEGELPELRAAQQRLLARFGGRIYPSPHITVQRFDASDPELRAQTIEALSRRFAQLEPFPLISAGLVQFFAPFWQKHVLRWKIARRPDWQGLYGLTTEILHAMGCAPHFPHSKDVTCSALELEHPLNLTSEDQEDRSEFLFHACRVVFSEIHGPSEFETLAEIRLSGS